MKCLEAQSYIMPFIDNKVPEIKQEEFVLHMKNCPKCHEELEIYYTLMVGMRQLDNNEVLSNNFARDMEHGLDKLQHKVKGRRGVKLSAFSIVMSGIMVVLFLFYGQCLGRVYAFEQRSKLSEQGNYYFYSSLYKNFQIKIDDKVAESEKLQTVEEESFYSKVARYNVIVGSLDEIFDIGQAIADD